MLDSLIILKTIKICKQNQVLFHKKLLTKIAIHEIKPIWTLGKLIYVGFSVRDLSKIFMNDYQYDYIKRKFDDKLLFTDIV